MLLAITAIILLYLIILIHEYGHYRAMKSYGIIPKSFMIGMGPKLFSTIIGDGTHFSLRLIPLIGAVHPGDYDISTLEKKQQLKINIWGIWYNILSAIPFGIILAYQLGYGDKYNFILLILGVIVGSILIPLISSAYVLIMMPTAMLKIFNNLGEVSNVDLLNGNIFEKVGAMGFSLEIQAIGFFYLVSVFVAGMNLIPITGTDGWHILKMYVADKFPKFWKGYNFVASTVLFLLIATTIINDSFGFAKLFQ